MRMRTAPMALAATLAAIASVASAQAGMNNIAVNPTVGTRAIPIMPDLKPRPLTMDSQSRLNCHPVRERDERGAWVTRTRCD